MVESIKDKVKDLLENEWYITYTCDKEGVWDMELVCEIRTRDGMKYTGDSYKNGILEFYEYAFTKYGKLYVDF